MKPHKLILSLSVSSALVSCSQSFFNAGSTKSGGGPATTPSAQVGQKQPVVVDCRGMSDAACKDAVSHSPNVGGPLVKVDCNNKSQQDCQTAVNQQYNDPRNNGGTIEVVGNDKPGATINGGTTAITPPSPSPTGGIIGGGTGGVNITKLGINYEDLPNGDFDYNDAVLCFTITGRLNTTDPSGPRVFSDSAQTVSVATSSKSDCNHNIRVNVVHTDGTSEPEVNFSSKTTNPINLNFKIGSELKVSFRNTSPCNGPEIPMTDTTRIRVLPNICNTSGK